MKPNLEELLPQTGRMILLSGILPCDTPRAAEAFVDISSSSLFFDAEADGVPGCVALEYLAQTMALAVGMDRKRRGLPPRQIGFILGSRRLTIRLPYFLSGQRYRTRATCTYSDEEFGSFTCTVTDPQNRIVAEGELTAYQSTSPLPTP